MAGIIVLLLLLVLLLLVLLVLLLLKRIPSRKGVGVVCLCLAGTPTRLLYTSYTAELRLQHIKARQACRCCIAGHATWESHVCNLGADDERLIMQNF